MQEVKKDKKRIEDREKLTKKKSWFIIDQLLSWKERNDCVFIYYMYRYNH